MTFWIMRHASAQPGEDAKDDDKRPLDPQGETEAKAVGQALKAIKTPIACCLSSPLRRSMQTAEIVCSYLGITPQEESQLSGSPVEVGHLVRDNELYLLVSHAPLTNLITYRMTGGQVTLAKGGLAEIHDGEIRTLLNPSNCMVIAGSAKFQDPAEVDQRSLNDLVVAPDEIVAPDPTRRAWKL